MKIYFVKYSYHLTLLNRWAIFRSQRKAKNGASKKNLPLAFSLIVDSTPRSNERNDSMYLRKMLLN